MHLGTNQRAGLLLLLDAGFASLALWVAYLLRFDDPAPHLEAYPKVLVALLVARTGANIYFRIHRWSFKFSSLRDGARIGLASVAGTVGFVMLGYFGLRSAGIDVAPRGVVVLEMLLSTALMAGVRFMPRLMWMYRADLWGRRKGSRTLIVGAGAVGETLLRSLQSKEDPDYHVVGFVDDDRGKWGHIVGGKPILGAVGELPSAVKALKVESVIIAIPGLSAERLREILSMAFAQNLRFRILPIGYGSLRDRDVAEALREVSTQDLLARAQLDLSGEGPGPDAQKLQMVVGAAGSIGSEVCGQLLSLGSRRLVMFDTDENGLYVLKRRLEKAFPKAQILAEVGDIREPRRLQQLFASHRPSDVFHAAARKHVPLMEAAPSEAVKTNVLGTQNLAQVSSEFGVARFIFMSTDKAVQPTSVMGASKRLGELLLHRMAETSSTRFSVVRFGNVLDSAGSVVPLFREQIAQGGPVTVTHPDVQRFFMTIAEAVGLVLRAAYGGYGRLCVLEMGEPIRIVDLARQMITLAGLVPDS
ncbi:MAG: polysaccharide biosynthesis protein, partial [Acidobacteriota bacterium]